MECTFIIFELFSMVILTNPLAEHWSKKPGIEQCQEHIFMRFIFVIAFHCIQGLERVHRKLFFVLCNPTTGKRSKYINLENVQSSELMFNCAFSILNHHFFIRRKSGCYYMAQSHLFHLQSAYILFFYRYIV